MIHRQPANFVQGISPKSSATASVILAIVDPELQQAFAQLEARLTARIDAVQARLEQQVETTETKLLTAFHNWAPTYDVRARGTSIAVREFEEHLGLIEERVAKLERLRN